MAVNHHFQGGNGIGNDAEKRLHENLIKSTTSSNIVSSTNTTNAYNAHNNHHTLANTTTNQPNSQTT